MALLGCLIIIFAIGFYYVLIPYLLTLLLNSFNFDIEFWQSLLVWWFIMIITARLKGGNKKNGN